MLGFFLFALTWTVEPSFAGRSTRSAAISISTCVRPPGRVITPGTNHVPETNETGGGQQAWLKGWEHAVRNAPMWTRSRREEFRRAIHADFNQHTAIAAEKFLGSVNADQLNQDYEWTVVERIDRWILLEAVPRDETERLFFGSFRVRLSARDFVPDRLIVVGRNRLQRTVWEADPASLDEQIRLVNFDDAIPPAPRSVVRISDARLE